LLTATSVRDLAQDAQVPVPVPPSGRGRYGVQAVAVLVGPVDADGRVVEPATRPGGQRVPGLPVGPDRLQPALPDHPRDGGPDRRRLHAQRREQPDQGGHGRPRAAGAQVVAVQVEKG
jgi:hypothetical protein